MPRAKFAGHQTLTFMSYFDAATGRTLTCDPGEVYDILPEIPPDDRFTPVEAEASPDPGDEDDDAFPPGQMEDLPGDIDS